MRRGFPAATGQALEKDDIRVNCCSGDKTPPNALRVQLLMHAYPRVAEQVLEKPAQTFFASPGYLRTSPRLQAPSTGSWETSMHWSDSTSTKAGSPVRHLVNVHLDQCRGMRHAKVSAGPLFLGPQRTPLSILVLFCS